MGRHGREEELAAGYHGRNVASDLGEKKRRGTKVRDGGGGEKGHHGRGQRAWREKAPCLGVDRMEKWGASAMAMAGMRRLAGSNRKKK